MREEMRKGKKEKEELDDDEETERGERNGKGPSMANSSIYRRD